MENIKKNQPEMKNAITEITSILEGIKADLMNTGSNQQFEN